ncbi:MAG: hypothetical protein HQM16_03515 [Deltaproteobacteria bacterium]|nr:hypothetical protein [Deltaproteobacteria bacterium]
MKTTTIKNFDCVKMKHHGAEEIQKKTKGMTDQQELEYWRKQTDQFKKERVLKKKTSLSV